MEVAILARRGRVMLPLDVRHWLASVAGAPGVQLLPLNLEIAIAAGELPDPIRDPSDRLIVATALHHHAPLVTKDSRIRAANAVETIW